MIMKITECQLFAEVGQNLPKLCFYTFLKIFEFYVLASRYVECRLSDYKPYHLQDK